MNQEEEREQRIDNFMRCLENYIQAEINEKITEQEQDSLGSYYEKKDLKEALMEIVP